MFYACVLQSIHNPAALYRGHTTDLKQRLADHNSGKCPHTSKLCPWKIKFYAAFETLDLAHEWESFLAVSMICLRKRILIKLRRCSMNWRRWSRGHPPGERQIRRLPIRLAPGANSNPSQAVLIPRPLRSNPWRPTLSREPCPFLNLNSKGR